MPAASNYYLVQNACVSPSHSSAVNLSDDISRLRYSKNRELNKERKPGKD